MPHSNVNSFTTVLGHRRAFDQNSDLDNAMKKQIYLALTFVPLAVAGCTTLPDDYLDTGLDPANPDAPEAARPAIETLMTDAAALRLPLPTNAPASSHEGHGQHGSSAELQNQGHTHHK